MTGKKRFLFLSPFLLVSLFLMSWGYNGHYKINYYSGLSLHPEMEAFSSWPAFLAEHASDADYRKETDPDEGPRHYIDIDNYPDYILNGRIPRTYDSVVALYGVAFVIDQGILPWATERTYDSLVTSFARYDWERAKLFASDLGHYLADAHNPLHLTLNYNGQYTGNYNIHSRYETGMINRFGDEINIAGRQVSRIMDVNEYIFGYIYENYRYVDSIMLADDLASDEAGSTSSDWYYELLWQHCRSFTIPLFDRASARLSELIYSAWVEAGRPDPASGPGIFEWNKGENLLKVQITPNPVWESVKIMLNLPVESDLCLKILNSSGAEMETWVNKKLPKGSYEFSFNLAPLPEGIYIVSFGAGRFSDASKFLKVN